MVTTGPWSRSQAGMLPAMSTCAITQPPKMVPWAFVSAGIGTIRITAVEPVDIDALTDADAIPDGFASATALQHELRTIYGEKLALGHKAFRIAFVRVEEVTSRESRVKSRHNKE